VGLPTDQLSRKDRAFLERLRKSEVPYWRKPIGWLLVALGFSMLAMNLVARMLHTVNHSGPLFFTGIIGLLAGAIQLQEVRYQTIVHHLLIARNGGGEKAGAESEQMEPTFNQLSPNDRKFLDRLRKSRADFSRKSIGWLLISFGCLVLVLCLLSILLQVGGSPFLFIGTIGLLAGLIELGEVRYRRIVRRLLVKRDGDDPLADGA